MEVKGHKSWYPKKKPTKKGETNTFQNYILGVYIRKTKTKKKTFTGSKVKQKAKRSCKKIRTVHTSNDEKSWKTCASVTICENWTERETRNLERYFVIYPKFLEYLYYTKKRK